MEKLTKEEIKETPLSYAMLICVGQCLPNVKAIYVSVDLATDTKNVYVTTDATVDEVNDFSIYLNSSGQHRIGTYNIYKIESVAETPAGVTDVSVILEDESISFSSVEDDVKQLIELTEDNNLKLYWLNDLIRLHTSNLDEHAKVCLMSSKCSDSFNKRVFASLHNFTHNYIHYGKRAAYLSYKELLKYRNELKAIIAYFDLDIVF